jgi:hypothetical protein
MINDKHDLLPTLALHGYIWQASSFRNGGVATHSSGWKVAADLDTGEWSHYRTRADKTTEGKHRESLVAHLRRMTYQALGSAKTHAQTLGSAKTHAQTLDALKACVRIGRRS